MTIRPIDWNRIEDDKDLEVWNRLTSNFWIPEKIPLSNDVQSWRTLSEVEQATTMRVFAGLTYLDTIQATIGAPVLMQDSVTQHEEAVFGNITFMEAFAAGTQLLTGTGWKNIEAITSEDIVAQYDPDNNVTSFAHPTIVPPHFSNDVYEIVAKNGNARQVVSGGHRVYVEEKVKKNNQCQDWVPAVYEARDLVNINLPSAHRRFRSAAPAADGEGMTDIDRMLVCINADGCFSGERYTGEKVGTIPARLAFSKQRKIDRFLTLAESIGWRVRETTQSAGKRNFYLDVPLDYVQDGRTKLMGKWWNVAYKSATWCRDFVEEIGLWDGHTQKGGGGVTFYTTNKQDSDFVVGAVALAGYRSHTAVRVDDRSDTFSDSYVTGITWNRDTVNAQSVSIKQAEPQMVYCVQVPTTFLVTRNGASPVISGNCVHARSYSSIFQTLATTPQINDAFRWVEEDPNMIYKRDRVISFYEGDDPLRRKAASVILETFLFYSGFYLPLKWASHSKLTNTADIIRLIIRDEVVHGYYIGYKYQVGLARRTQAEQQAIKDEVFDLLLDLYDNECAYTETLYDELGWTEDVKRFLRYNANKALNNLGYEGLFPQDECRVSPAILASLDPGANENHDFFAGSGSAYTIGTAEETTDDDWGF